MHNTLTRVQNAFGFFTSCAFAIASLIAIISIIPLPSPTSYPSASISLRNIQVVKGRPHYHSPKREEYASIRFDLDADLSGLFTWNTKQIFVYVVARYPSSSSSDKAGAGGGGGGGVGGGRVSEAVIWDTIIPAPASPYTFANLKARYLPAKSSSSTKKPTRKPSTSSSSKTTDLTKPGRLLLKNQKPKYQITDPSGLMGERSNATLALGWNVQPWVGALVWDQSYLGNRVGAWQVGKAGRSQVFDFPALKSARATESVKVGGGAGSGTPEAGSAAPAVEV